MCKKDCVSEGCEFEVGQKVFDIQFGEGKVVGIGSASEGDYRVRVSFFGGPAIRGYTGDGKYYSERSRTLFFAMPKITEECLTPPVPPRARFNPGDIVIRKVGVTGQCRSVRYVCSDDGGIYVTLFRDGDDTGSTIECEPARLTLLKKAAD